MKITVQRYPSTDKSTLGQLTIDDGFSCVTLEDPVRKEKIYGETAIPAGTYKVVVGFSPHFKRELPLLLNVPNYEGVRIHPGNVASDTEGCILVGTSKGSDRIFESVKAFTPLYQKINSAFIKGEPIFIEIKDAP